MKICHHCGRELPTLAEVRREDSCPNCQSDVKCCMNCRFHDPGAHNQCREPAAEWQGEKTKANFCEFFELREIEAFGRPGLGGPRTDRSRAREALEALFRKE